MTATQQPRVTVITGSASGMGLEISRTLATPEHTLVLVDRDAAVHDVASELSGRAAGAASYITDLSDPEQVLELTRRITAEHGGVDILVNNAGIHPKRQDGSHFPIPEIDLDQWRLVFDVNVTAVFLLSQWALASMTPRGWGRIVNIASRAGRMYSSVAGAQYAASKAAVIGFTRNLAGEAGPHGITANTVAPGRVKTPLSDIGGESGDLDLHGMFADMVPVGRIGRPEEIAAVVEFLVSEKSSFLTGAVLDVNGGVFG